MILCRSVTPGVCLFSQEEAGGCWGDCTVGEMFALQAQGPKLDVWTELQNCGHDKGASVIPDSACWDRLVSGTNGPQALREWEILSPETKWTTPSEHLELEVVSLASMRIYTHVYAQL